MSAQFVFEPLNVDWFAGLADIQVLDKQVPDTQVPDIQVPGHPGLSDTQVPGRPGPRTSRPLGLPGLSDIQVPGRPSPRTNRPFGLPGLRTSRSFGRPLIVGSIYPIQIYKIQVKYISQIVCSLSNRKLTFIPQMLA